MNVFINHCGQVMSGMMITANETDRFRTIEYLKITFDIRSVQFEKEQYTNLKNNTNLLFNHKE